MKKLLLVSLILMSITLYSQTSNYYGRVKVSGSIDVNQNINQKITKTVKTIDYGALALANAEKEKNRIERSKYSDSKNRRESIEIASNPIKAFDYGKTNTWVTRTQANPGAALPIYKKNKVTKGWGFKYFTLSHKKPHPALFNKISLEGGGGYSYQNISEDFIDSVIEIYTPNNINAEVNIQLKKLFKNGDKDVLKLAKMNEMVIGETNEGVFVHNKELKKAKVFGKNGYKGSMIYEDDFEYVISDNYYSLSNGIFYRAKVRTKGDKEEVTFEQLEGRRFYLRRLMEQIISTAVIKDYKLDK